MIVNEQNVAKRSGAPQNLRDQRCDVRLLIESGNDDRDGCGEGGKVCHCASGTFSVERPTFNVQLIRKLQSKPPAYVSFRRGRLDFVLRSKRRLEPTTGFEPVTCGLRNRCSTS